MGRGGELVRGLKEGERKKGNQMDKESGVDPLRGLPDYRWAAQQDFGCMQHTASRLQTPEASQVFAGKDKEKIKVCKPSLVAHTNSMVLPGSQSCPNLMHTTRSSSDKMAWSTCHPFVKCGSIYLKRKKRGRGRGKWKNRAA